MPSIEASAVCETLGSIWSAHLSPRDLVVVDTYVRDALVWGAGVWRDCGRPSEAIDGESSTDR